MATEEEEAGFELPSKIIDQLYVGTAYHGWDDEVLKKLNITHIVCCISGSSISNPKHNIKRLWIPMDDRGYSSLTEKIETAFPFIVNAIESDKNNNVLIHCKGAVNRSPTICVAFLMYFKHYTLKESHSIVSKNHQLMCCHHNYMDQLREYDKKLYGKYSTKPDELETTKSMMAKLRQQFMIQNNNKNEESKEQKISDDNNNNNNNNDNNDNNDDNEEEKKEYKLPSKILESIYCGTDHHASNMDILQELKITHIVCCMSGNININNKNIKHLMVPIDDKGNSVIKTELEKAYPFILDALKDDTNNILFHCRSSVNRSPTMIVAFLMKYKAMTLKAAHTMIQEKHELICTHYKYMDQLREYDKELFGIYSTKPDELETNKSMIQRVRQKLKDQNTATH